jgi:hypothetical protein
VRTPVTGCGCDGVHDRQGGCGELGCWGEGGGGARGRGTGPQRGKRTQHTSPYPTRARTHAHDNNTGAAVNTAATRAIAAKLACAAEWRRRASTRQGKHPQKRRLLAGRRHSRGGMGCPAPVSYDSTLPASSSVSNGCTRASPLRRRIPLPVRPSLQVDSAATGNTENAGFQA